jgi:glycosyltransferase involved in cell wall biosynthesis
MGLGISSRATNVKLLVSVVINNHNYARFLGAAIESGLGQTYSNMEVVVVDDGSTDDTAEVMASYAGRITAVRQANGGQAAAINTGFAHSRGDIVIFLDADDVLLPQIAEKVAAAFEDSPELARVQYRLAVVTRNGEPTGELFPAAASPMPSGDHRAEVARFNNYAWWPPMSGNAFSAKTLQRIMPMPEPSFRLAADYYLVRSATLCGPIRSLDEVGAHYRRHDHNWSLRAGLDLGQIRSNIRLIDNAHEALRQFAAAIHFDGFPASASDAWDLPFFALRMASLRLERMEHPVPEDRLLPLAMRGASVALRQTHRSLVYRCLAAAWFGAMTVSPVPLARSLAQWFFFPETRPHVRWLKPAEAEALR